MNFLQPEWLWMLLLWPLGLALYIWLLRRRRQAVLWSSLALIRQAQGKTSWWRRHLPPALLGLALVMAVLAMARPTARVTLPSDHMTLILAIDVSRSMLAQDVEPSRIEAAQAAARQFLQDLPANIRVGLVTFAGNAQVAQHVTDRREDLLAAIDRFQLQRATATGSGLLLSLSTLMPHIEFDLNDVSAQAALAQREPGSYTGGAIVLLSDGRRTNGPDPVVVAHLAARQGVRVYTVAFGTPNGFIPGYEGYSFFTRVDEEALKAVADITGADFYRASTAHDLHQVYQHLTQQFSLETRESEISVLWVLAALVLTLLAWWLGARWHQPLSAPVSSVPHSG
jgi:Ca-activated chloride channel family protein